MDAVRLWVRSMTRANRASTALLIVLTGLTVGVVSATFEAAQRSTSSLQRFLDGTRQYDVATVSCPPEVKPEQISDLRVIREKCVGPETAERLRKVVAGFRSVEFSAAADQFPIGLLDETAPNGWGHLVNDNNLAIRTNGVPSTFEKPVLLAGRMPRTEARDEIVITATLARDAHLGVGDTLRLAGWSAQNLDLAGGSGTLRPDRPEFTSLVSGIIRTSADVVAVQVPQIGGNTYAGGLSAGPAWAEAHTDHFARWTTSVVMRLRDPVHGLDTLRSELRAAGWTAGELSAFHSTDAVRPIRRAVDVEHEAALIFAIVGLLAGIGVVGLVAHRQFAGELSERETLEALGATRGDATRAALLRSTTIAVPGWLLGTSIAVVASTRTPIGVARRLELERGPRFSIALMAATFVVVLTVYGIAAAASGLRRTRPSRTRTSTTRPALSSSPSWRVVRALVDGRSAMLAGSVVAVAVSATLAAAVTVASFDRLFAEPRRVGAWSDAAPFGNYASFDEFDAAAAKAKGIPDVLDVAAIRAQSLSIDGGRQGVIAIETIAGSPPKLPITQGRAPIANGEIALTRPTLQAVRKSVGDEVTLAGDGGSMTVRIVGTVIVTPICCESVGAIVTTPTLVRLSGIQFPGQLTLRFRPGVDRDEAIARLSKDFPGLQATALPIDVTNLGRVRRVPWLIAGLVWILAIGTLVHALLTLLRRHRHDFEIVRALGFSSRQTRAVARGVALRFAGVGALIGLPLGVVVGRRVWAILVRRLDVLPGAWLAVVGPVAVAGCCALLVAAAVGRVVDAAVPNRVGDVRGIDLA